MSEAKRIIGIDPGLLHTGWGVVDTVGSQKSYVASGVILPPKNDNLPARLSFIFKGLSTLLDIWKPDCAGIEIIFVNQNPATTLLLGHARAAAILAVATKEVPLFEYEPNVIKKAVTGRGHADKSQIDAMVRALLPNARSSSPDESDALAIAITHANYFRPI
ncbi:MAG: crossover junction endodeoxyribonuclease RuvC [Rickettsiales bacterium]|nr:crossover junction endodeoxyribonuclease RuvC [Rickettsiales bacterium]